MKILSTDRKPIAACVVIRLDNGFQLSMSTISTVPDMRLFWRSRFDDFGVMQDMTSKCFEDSDYVDITPENILTAIQFAKNY